VAPAFQRWAATVDWDHLPWPFNVLIEMPPERVLTTPGVSTKEMLEVVVGKMVDGTLGVVPCQGNTEVVALLNPVNEVCAEISLYSTDSTFGLYRESKRILEWLFKTLPYTQYVSGNNIPEFRRFLNRLGFVGPIEIPNYHPLGGSWLYYYITDDLRKGHG
jgi:hypothetical protein